MRGRPATLAALAVSAALALPAPLRAQDAGRRWIVRSDPATDLWYHGLALAGATGFGELPLTDPGYAARVRAAGGSPLAGDASRLRGAFAADSAFEVLQFVPVWFALQDRAAVNAALRRVAREGPAAIPSLSLRERVGAAAVAATLRTPEQRRVLAGFLDALDREWTAFFSGWRTVAAPDSSVAAAAVRWAELAAALAPHLRAERLDGGLVLVSPALGTDGRFFEGVPGDPDDNVVAVQLPPSGGDAAYLVVRELCYPVVVRASARVGEAADRVAAERSRGRAAVQCGASLLDRYAPDHAPRYRSFWQRAGGQAVSFDQAFAIPDDLRAALQRELGTP